MCQSQWPIANCAVSIFQGGPSSENKVRLLAWNSENNQATVQISVSNPRDAQRLWSLLRSTSQPSDGGAGLTRRLVVQTDPRTRTYNDCNRSLEFECNRSSVEENPVCQVTMETASRCVYPPRWEQN